MKFVSMDKIYELSDEVGSAYVDVCLIDNELATERVIPIEVLEEIWNKTYRLHPINRGDNDYANGVYDGMCRVIDIVCNTIDSKIKELSE